jgi:GT2 family glycosyltransferase
MLCVRRSKALYFILTDDFKDLQSAYSAWAITFFYYGSMFTPRNTQTTGPPDSFMYYEETFYCNKALWADLEFVI